MKRSNAPLVSLLFVVASLIGLLNFTFPAWGEHTKLRSESAELDGKIAEKSAVLTQLRTAKANADKELVAKYSNRFREDKVIGTLFDAQRVDVQIGDFSMSEGGTAANGLSVGTVTFSPVFKNEAGLRSYLNWLTQNEVVLTNMTLDRGAAKDAPVRAPMTVAIHYVR